MFGAHNSVSKLLVEKYPWIMPVKCSCHSIHLCASYACKKLPKSLEDLCRNIYAHFNASSKRMDALKELQEFLGTEKHRKLQAGQTRWLSMKLCIDRIIDHNEVLTQYFTLAVFENQMHTNDLILKSLKNNFTLAHLEFIAHNLDWLTSFNLLFQSKTPSLHQLEQEVSRLVKAICADLMELKYVRAADPFSIDQKTQSSQSN